MVDSGAGVRCRKPAIQDALNQPAIGQPGMANALWALFRNCTVGQVFWGSLARNIG